MPQTQSMWIKVVNMVLRHMLKWTTFIKWIIPPKKSNIHEWILQQIQISYHFFKKSNNLKNFRDFRKHGVSQWFKTELKTELRSGGGSRDAV